jgi:hypothetical protein
MKFVARLFVPVFAFALFLALTPTHTFAHGSHPAYLHALSDLRAARSLLERPDHGELRHEERKPAITSIRPSTKSKKPLSMTEKT